MATFPRTKRSINGFNRGSNRARARKRAAFVRGPSGCGKAPWSVSACKRQVSPLRNIGGIRSQAHPSRHRGQCHPFIRIFADVASPRRFSELVLSSIRQASFFGIPAVVVEDLDAIFSVVCGGTEGWDASRRDEKEVKKLVEGLSKVTPRCAPLIFVCSDESRRACRQLREVCLDVKLAAVSRPTLKSLARSVASKEGKELVDGVCDFLASSARGDIRILLNALDMELRKRPDTQRVQALASARKRGSALIHKHCEDVFPVHSFQAAELLLHSRCARSAKRKTQTPIECEATSVQGKHLTLTVRCRSISAIRNCSPSWSFRTTSHPLQPSASSHNPAASTTTRDSRMLGWWPTCTPRWMS